MIAYTRIWDSEGRPVPVPVKYREEKEHALIESPQLFQRHRGPPDKISNPYIEEDTDIYANTGDPEKHAWIRRAREPE